MRKVNNKTLALLHDHVLRLSENVAPTLTDVLDSPEGVLREITQDAQHDFMEQVLIHNRFWTFLPHAGLVRVDAILPSGTICCFSPSNAVSNTTASDMTSKDFSLWRMDRPEHDMINNILQGLSFERSGLNFIAYFNESAHLWLVDPANTDQLWLTLVIEEKTHKDTVNRSYAIRWSDVLCNHEAYSVLDAPTTELLIASMNRFLFNDCGILTVIEAELASV